MISPIRLNDKTLKILIPALLILIVAAFYWRVIHFDFVLWDDDAYVFDNPLIRSFSGANIIAWFTRPFVSLYVPLPMASYALDYHLYGNHPGGYHFTNLLLHLANTFLVYSLFNHFFKKNRAVSFLSALLFAIHPVQAESVAWISERKNLLSAFFFLAGFLYYLRTSGDNGQARKTGSWLILMLLFTASVLSKITAVMAPLVWLSYDIFTGQKNRAKAVWFYALMFSAAFLAGLLTLSLYPALWGHLFSGDPARFLVRQIGAFFTYLKIIFWPKNLRLFYGEALLVRISLVKLTLRLALTAGFLTAVELIAWRLPKTRFWAAWFILLLLPVCGFFPVLTCGHHLYLPVIGMIGFLAAMLENRKTILVGLLILANLVLMPVAYSDTGVWADGQSLWKRFLSADPTDYLGNMQLAGAYKVSGDTAKAAEVYEEMRRSYPAAGHPYVNLVSHYLTTGETEKAGQVAEDMAQNVSGDTDVYYTRAQIAFDKGDTGTARQILAEAIQKGSVNPGVYHLMGLLYYRQGQFANALPLLRMAVRLNPKHYQARHLIGLCLAGLKRPQEALAELQELLADRVYIPGIYFDTGCVYLQLNQPEAAKNAFKLSARLEPQAREAYRFLGMISLSEGKKEEAATYIRMAGELSSPPAKKS